MRRVDADLPTDPQARARTFHDVHARRLRALAYRLLGSTADAEDVVQDAWLRWSAVDEREVAHAGAYLSRLVTHLCLDRMQAAAARRELYVGTWLPEPLLDDDRHFAPVPGPEQQAEFAEAVSVAFLLALDRLGPLERAAFLLHDVFDLDFAEVAAHVDRSEAACRQLVSRARRHVRDAARGSPAPAPAPLHLAEAFMQALQTRDASALARVLAHDVVMLSDGGGKATAVPRPLHGAPRVAQVFAGFARLPEAQAWRLLPARINGLPGLVVLDGADGDRVVQTFTFAPDAADATRIAAVYVQRNPDKLGSARRWWGDADVTNRGAASS